jgi:hypothetical protein
MAKNTPDVDIDALQEPGEPTSDHGSTTTVSEETIADSDPASTAAENVGTAQDRAEQAQDGGEPSGSTVSDDYFTNPDVAALVALPTALDGQGNERIVGTTSDNWKMPPAELTSEEIAAAEKREEAFAAAREARLGLADK